jgi:hypothetical protein
LGHVAHLLKCRALWCKFCNFPASDIEAFLAAGSNTTPNTEYVSKKMRQCQAEKEKGKRNHVDPTFHYVWE